MSPQPPASGAMTLDEAAAYLAIKPSRLTALRKAGKIMAVQIGGNPQRPRVRYVRAELDAFLQRESQLIPGKDQLEKAARDRSRAINGAAHRARMTVAKLSGADMR